MQQQYIFFFLISIVVVGFIFDQWLDFLNARAQKKSIPELIKAYYDEETYLKQQQYEKTKFNVSRITDLISFVAILIMLTAGGFAWLDALVRSFSSSEIIQTILFFGFIALASDLIGMPIDMYYTFVVEERFGFNRMTIKTYILDTLKGWLIAAIIGGIILSIIVWLYQKTGAWFWVLAWGTVAAFTLFMSYFYTTLLVPIFNKLTPLNEGELRSAIKLVAQKTGFSLHDIFIMDGSRRSAKGNAYFSGFGRKKSIVLFDTLINDHSTEELAAIIAHEIGHYKKKHVVSGLLLGILQMGLLFFLLSVLLTYQEVAFSIGITQPSFYIGIVLFAILYSPISTVLGIGMNLISRKNEFAADRFSAETTSPTALKSALVNLSVKNLSNLTPHRFYVFVHYSHPTLIQRVEALDGYKTIQNEHASHIE